MTRRPFISRRRRVLVPIATPGPVRVNRDPNYPSAMASHVRNDLRADIASDAYV